MCPACFRSPRRPRVNVTTVPTVLLPSSHTLPTSYHMNSNIQPNPPKSKNVHLHARSSFSILPSRCVLKDQPVPYNALSRLVLRNSARVVRTGLHLGLGFGAVVASGGRGDSSLGLCNSINHKMTIRFRQIMILSLSLIRTVRGTSSRKIIRRIVRYLRDSKNSYRV